MNIRPWLAFALLAGCAHGGGARAGYAGWTTVATEHFAVHTPLSAGDGEETALRLERVAQALMRGFFPRSHLDPIDVLVFAEPEDAGLAAEDAASAGPGGTAQHGALVVSLRDRHRRRGPGTGEERFTSSWQIAAARALAHRFLDQAMEHPPAWFREGLGRYVSTVQIQDDAAIFGHRPNDLAWDLAKGRALPLSELLETTPAQLHGLDARVYEAGCWGFVHYLLGGEDGKLRGRFDVLTDALIHGADSRAALARAFPGVPLEEIDGRVHQYLVDVLGRRSTFHPYPVSLAPPPSLRGTGKPSDPARIQALLLGIPRQ